MNSTEITGVYVSRGNAVDCPQIRGDDGQLHSVIGVSSDIAIGDRIRVSGHYAVSTRCRGQALVVEEQQKLQK
ncbi:hypothetical protein [Oryzicola mucosus]|uniref:Uncharacterized protein n=1 Tax=Oryzicola mucosus TaxID=2767425 RepID=A0A8J6PET0_9HYPH|nr:hypothetical protein [Oryzicola mucosus]MBD0413674.1 hypothetical protein [Oryzicola mucosus]